MRTYSFKNGKIIKEMPETWKETTDEQHGYLLQLICRAWCNEIDLYDVRMMFTTFVLSYQPSKRLAKKKRQRVNLTLHQIAEASTFFYKFNEEAGLFEFVLDENPRGACKISHTGFVPAKGFENLTCEQFVDAFEYYNAYVATQDEMYLRLLCATLYQKPYTTQAANLFAQRLRNGEWWEPLAALHYFSSNMKAITTSQRYGVLFGGGASEDTGKIKLGMAATIYQIMDEYKIGLEEVRHYPFPQYLELLLRQHIKHVQELRASGKNDIEIAEAMKLNLEQLNFIS